MRIAVLTNSFPMISETFILRQVTGLLDLGHSVHVVAEFSPDISQPLHADVERLQLLEHTSYVNMPPLRNASRFLALRKTLVECFRAAPVATIAALNPLAYGRRAISFSNVFRLGTLLPHLHSLDVLHAHFGPVGEQFRFARRSCGIPLVVSFHGYDFSTYPRSHGENCYRRLFQEADLITVNSEYSRRCVENLGCPKEKLRLLHEGLDPGEFTFRERMLPIDGQISLLTVARLVPKKGIEYALRALSEVLHTYPKVRYSIIGDGPLLSPLLQLTQSLGINHAVTFHGAGSGEIVRAAMDRADIFLLTSTSASGDMEGQGLVVQEAQASGMPIIVTKHGPLPEGIVADKSGFIAPEGDPVAIAKAICRLIEGGNNWPAMGRVGRDYVAATYDINHLNAYLVKIYEEALYLYRRKRT